MTADTGDQSEKTRAISLDAFDELYETHHHSVFRFAYYLTRSRDEAEELFQETWFRVVKALEKTKDIRDFQAWAFTITANTHRDILRKKRVRRLFHGDASETQYKHRSICSGSETDMNPVELGMAIREAITGLPDKQRRVFVLKEIEGFKHHEIGVILNIPTGTVKSLLHRAVKHLLLQLT